MSDAGWRGSAAGADLAYRRGPPGDDPDTGVNGIRALVTCFQVRGCAHAYLSVVNVTLTASDLRLWSARICPVRVEAQSSTGVA